MPDGAIVALDISVLLGLTGLDVLDRDAPFLSPDQQLATDVFRAVVDPYGAGLSTPFDDPVQAADDTFRWQRKVDLDPQPFAVEVSRLAEPGGVSLAALMAATGWQAHTIRAVLSGLRKVGLTITRRRAGEATIYASSGSVGVRSIEDPNSEDVCPAVPPAKSDASTVETAATVALTDAPTASEASA